jgi:hypothetical protein
MTKSLVCSSILCANVLPHFAPPLNLNIFMGEIAVLLLFSMHICDMLFRNRWLKVRIISRDKSYLLLFKMKSAVNMHGNRETGVLLNYFFDCLRNQKK